MEVLVTMVSSTYNVQTSRQDIARLLFTSEQPMNAEILLGINASRFYSMHTGTRLEFLPWL